MTCASKTGPQSALHSANRCAMRRGAVLVNETRAQVTGTALD
jgi:hypothetical protein